MARRDSVLLLRGDPEPEFRADQGWGTHVCIIGHLSETQCHKW